MMKNFMEIGGVVKKIYSYPSPQNILEGNGVVFENFTINHGNGGGGGQNKLFIPPIYS